MLIRISIPDGKPTELPEKYEMNNEMAAVFLEYSIIGTAIEIKGHYKFKKSVYEPNEYSRLKFYMNDVVKYFNGQIIMEEIKPQALK